MSLSNRAGGGSKNRNVNLKNTVHTAVESDWDYRAVWEKTDLGWCGKPASINYTHKVR